MTVNVLGTTYKIETHKLRDDETLKKNSWGGYINFDEKKIVLADFDDTEDFTFSSDTSRAAYKNKTLRHEIVHAFLEESGLSESSAVPQCGWAQHEEMVDWFAIQAPKIFAAFRGCYCIG